MNNQFEGQTQVVAVRYIVNNVDSAVAFYTNVLGFEVNQHTKSAFADLSLGNLRLLINQPGAGAAGQAMPDGTLPAPGGWNRIQIEVKNLEAVFDRLRKEGAQFRNEIVTNSG